MQVNSIPRILCLTLALLPTLIFAQPMAPHVRKGVPQEVLLQSKSLNCGDIVYSLQVINNGSSCCYRLKADNSNPDNCFVNVALNLDMGAFANFIALPGWQYNTGGPAEYTVRPFMGFIPPGSSSLAEFCIDGTTSATLTLLWEDLCILEGCAATFDVNGCLDPGDASITGVAYLECESLPYSNQVTLPGWTIQLLDTMGNVIAEQVTDVNGAYAFYDLVAGVYVVKEIAASGWSPSVPASGKTTVDLSASEQEIRNFGNCRANCLCSSIQTSVIPLSSTPTECCYNLKTQVLGGGDYCFQYLNVQVDAGQFITSWIPQTGWIFTQINPQSIKISPISGIIPLGTYIPGSICISGNGTHNILVTAGFEDSAGPHECDASYSFNCPPPQNPCACPSGFPGNNLCINGNFSGLGGFTSNYVLNNVGPLLEGQFWVGANPSLINAGFQACGDHTSGSGNMMVVNGATNASTKIWCETITVSANTNYQFGAWIASLAAASPAQLQLFVNNVSVGGSFQASTQPCDWQQYCQSWFSGTNTTATICLVNLNPSASGNDFALDDLSFRACVSISNCIRGTVYVACDSMPFTNQPTLLGWTISLLNSMGVVLDTMVTDSTGAYAFCDLVPGNYVVKTSKPGWTANIPASGEYVVMLGQSQDLVRDFGECQDVGCSDISFFIENYEPCKYRLNIDNSSECFPFLRLKLDTESHDNWREDTLSGWTAEMLSSTEILLKHNSGHIPLGASTPIQFSITPGISTNLAIIWDISCAPGGSCSDTFPLPGCPATPCQASISVTQGPNCTVQVTAVTAGSQPVSYQWCDGRTDASFTTSQLPCVPTTYCVTVTCSDGSTSTALVVFTAQDLTPPTAVCNPGVGVDLDANCAFQVTTGFVDGGSTDNCGIMSMSVSPTTLVGCANTIVTLTVTDWCGNTSTCTMGIETNEEEPPMLTCPANTSVTGTNGPNGLCTATYSPTVPVATDNCDPSVTVMNNAPTVLQQGPNTISWTATDDCGNQTVCNQIVTVVCIGTVCPSCPPNTVQGPELIYNGDFSKGYNYFITDFRPKFASGTSSIVGGFSVINGSQVSLANTDWECFDHTTGLPSDKFFVSDGPAVTSVHTNAWKEGVQVLPGRHYSFCMFANNLRIIPPTPGDYTDPEVEILINSVVVAGPITVPESPDQWVSISVPWDAGINTLALIEIRNVAPGNTGNDLALDDISFRECMTDTCYCGPFADMFVRWPQETSGNALTCGDTLSVKCEAGLNATFTGTFLCNGSACSGNPPVDWVLFDPSSNVIASGTTSAVPYFGLGLPPSYFLTSGVYKLQLTGYCNTSECACEIFLSVQACLDPCACDAEEEQSFQSRVNKGFANVLWNNSCKACFSPFELKDCENVEWKVNGVSVGTSVGNQPFCQIFPNAGTYTTTMIATRQKSDGTVCKTFSKSQNVNITCSVPDPCPITIVPNPEFSQGALFGSLNQGGISNGWSGPIGNPYILTDGIEMTIDSSVMFLWGNNDSYDVLSRDTFDCWPKDTGMVSFRAKVDWFIFKILPPIEHKLLPIPAEDPCPKWCDCHPCPGGIAAPNMPGESFNFQLRNSEVSNLDCESESCFRMASILLPEPDTLGTWFTIELPYDTRIWDPTGSGGGCTPNTFPNLSGVAARPAIFITNWLGSNQGGSHSAMMLDGICFKSATVDIPIISLAPTFRIFPNPNPGTFSVELHEPASPDLSFRIIGLTGQLLREQHTQTGSTMQTVQAGDLPAGLYFLQVRSEGRVLATEKFIKQ